MIPAMPRTLAMVAWLWVGGAFAQDLGPEPQFPTLDPERVKLGQLLFYDPILSGNRNISCATCHHPRFATSDGVSLGIGEGGQGVGPDRVLSPENRPEQRLPRNAPALFNLGAAEFNVMFHDGRLEADSRHPDGMRTPLGQEMVSGFSSVLAAQAMFPVLSGDEMAGHYSENEIAQAVRLGHLSLPGGAWDLIAARVGAIPEYRQRFAPLLGEGDDIRFTDIANVIADFISFEWRANDSEFDRYLRGEAALSPLAEAGRQLFYGKAACANCHSGWFQTDHGFHAIAMPQIGPGKAARFENHVRDEGRGRVTGEDQDRYRFRTPSLRNVMLTAPYGHSGAYSDLEEVLRHHLDPRTALKEYELRAATLPDFPGVRDDRLLGDVEVRAALSAANELEVSELSDAEVEALLAFLGALTDLSWRGARLGVPETVPSGLPVDK